MVIRCWRFWGEGWNDPLYYEIFKCGTEPSFVPGSNSFLSPYLDGLYVYDASYQFKFGKAYYEVVNTIVRNYPGRSLGDCLGCENRANTTYDCVNGACVINSKSMGLFESLSDCEASCRLGCPPGEICVNPNTYCAPGKVCLERIEYNQIQTLVTSILNEI